MIIVDIGGVIRSNMLIYYYECVECGYQGEKEFDLFMLSHKDTCPLCDSDMELQQWEVDGETERLW